MGSLMTTRQMVASRQAAIDETAADFLLYEPNTVAALSLAARGLKVVPVFYRPKTGEWTPNKGFLDNGLTNRKEIIAA